MASTANLMTCTYCKNVITNTTYTSQAQKDEMQVKLDVFMLNNRITPDDEYPGLTTMLSNKQIAA